MKKQLSIFIQILLCIVLQGSYSYAQYGSNWRKIGQLPNDIDGQPVLTVCGYFFDKNSGLIGKGSKGTSGNIGSSLQIYYTSNGKVWRESTMPAYAKFVEGKIYRIRMINRNDGYAVVWYHQNNVGITSLLLTKDGGETWFDSPITDAGEYSDMYLSNNAPILVSWQSGPGFAQIDSNIYILSANFNSIDKGQTWNSSLKISVTPSMNESWGAYGSRKWKKFFCAPENSDNPIFGPITSVDSGRTWQQDGFFPDDQYGKWRVTGDVAGGTDAVYVQSSIAWNGAPGRGLSRTTDGGTTWKNIGGPSNYLDTRFCVFGCRGANVVAFDTIGGIWLTENGGDGTMHEDTARLWFEAKQLSVTSSLCDTARSGIRIWNEHCNIVRLDSMWFDLRDSSLFTSGALTLDTIPFNGRILGVDATDSIGFIWRPRIITDRDTTYRVPLHIRYWTETTNEMKDTILLIELHSARGNTSHTLSSYSVDFASVSMCSSRDTVITITNNGCDTLRIADVKLQGIDYVLTQNPNGIRLAPGASTSVSVRFSPSSLGVVQASLFITLWEQGKLTTREVPLRGTGTEGDGAFAYEPKSFDFNTLSICSRDSGSGYITNIGCDTLSLSDVTLFAQSDYIMSSLPSLFVLPDDTIRYTVYVNPQMKGIRTGYVVFTTTNRSGARKDSLSLSITVTDGTRILASTPNSLDFGTTTLCEERDSLVTLRNTGCDTLRVSGVGVSGDGYRVSGIGFPIIIPPGGSIDIPVNTTVDTSQGSISTGTITFTSDADNQIPPIPLSRSYTYPKSYSFHIGMIEGTATSDEIVRLAIVGEQGLGSAGSGVNRLDFDLSLNEDLLEYIRPEGSNTVNKNGSRITISNSNELTSYKDTLAILVYHVFLTKDSATDIAVSNILINNGDTSSCASRIASNSQAGFTYRYECGDKHIQSFLRTGKASVDIRSLVPNPTASDITIIVVSAEAQTATLEVYDMLGKKCYQMLLTLADETSDITLPTNLLPEGQYIVRIGTASGSATQIFTKTVK